jgi:hypothetical protein
MKNVFDKIRAVCYVCGTPLDGKELLRRGDKYYCESDYEKTSVREKLENHLQKLRDKKQKEFFQQ